MAITKPVALVTGGANGIGRAIAHHLLAAGWRVGIIDMPGSGLKRAFPPRNRNVVLVEGDVGEEETVSRAVKTLVEQLRPARCGGLQRRHHDPQTAAPADARRMASRHRHQSHRGVPAGARRRAAAAQSARRHRPHRLDPGADVGAEHGILFGLERRAGRAHPRARHQPRAGRARQLRQPRLDRDQELRRAAPQGSRAASRWAASASRRISPRSSPGSSTPSARASSPAPISSSTAA